MKGLTAWILLALASLAIIVWIFDGFRNDVREDSVFFEIGRERHEYANDDDGPVTIAAAGNWDKHVSMLQGIRCAVEQTEKQGGVLGRTVKLKPMNDHGNIETGLEIAQNISSDTTIPMVIGHTEPRINSAVSQNYEFYKVLCFSPNTAPQETVKNYALHFSNGMSAHQVAKALVELSVINGWKTIGVIHSENRDDADLARQFESLAGTKGLEVPLTFLYAGQKSAIHTRMEHWKRELNLDAMVIAMFPKDAARIISACRVMGIECPFVLMGDAPWHHNPKAAEFMGTTYRTGLFPTDTKAFRDFAAIYEKKYGVHPDYEAVLGFDAFMMLTEAVKKAGSFSPELVADALEKHVQPSISGTTEFTRHGGAIKVQPTFHMQSGS